MALLSKDQIFNVNDIPVEDVSVPEWGGEVRVRGLTGTERDRFESDSLMNRKGSQEVNLKNLRARLIVACAIDESGQPLFTLGDVMRLGQMSARALTRVFAVAQRLSGMDDEDLNELTGNLEPDQKDSSTSG
jgi:hypothetical protein